MDFHEICWTGPYTKVLIKHEFHENRCVDSHVSPLSWPRLTRHWRWCALGSDRTNGVTRLDAAIFRKWRCAIEQLCNNGWGLLQCLWSLNPMCFTSIMVLLCCVCDTPSQQTAVRLRRPRSWPESPHRQPGLFDRKMECVHMTTYYESGIALILSQHLPGMKERHPKKISE